MDADGIKDRTRETWSLGTYAPLADLIRPAARALVDGCAISAGQEVLDVAAGTGNVAVLAAAEGARVVASDLTPHLIEQGRVRSEAEGLDIEWVEADVESLPFEDGSFECVTSCFGAMFAPRPEVAAREMFRVVRAGGTVGMANWVPDGYFGRLRALENRYLPQPEGMPRPTEWGEEPFVRARLDGLAASIETSLGSVPFEFESVEALLDFFGDHAGPQVALHEALDAESLHALRRESAALAAEHNRAEDGSLAIDAEYLLVVARRRG